MRDDRVLPIDVAASGLDRRSARIAAGGADALDAMSGPGSMRQPAGAGVPLDDGRRSARPCPDPGAIYTVGLNYDGPGRGGRGPERPLIYGKAAASVAGHGASLAWDRSVTDNVDAECELGVVIGARTSGRACHVFGYTCINDISSRDEWLDGDQWLLGKSMPGFCPVGPVDRHAPTRSTRPTCGLGCTINGEPIQDGRTSQMRFAIAEIDRVPQPPRRAPAGRPDRDRHAGPPRRRRPGRTATCDAGDTVTVWIEGIGELTTTIA